MNRPNTAVEPHQLLDDIVIAFLSFWKLTFFRIDSIICGRFFCTIPVICLFLSLSFVVRIWLLMTSENCLLFSHVRSSDTFFDKRRELRLNHHNIQCDHNSLFMEYWAMTKTNQFIVTNTLIAMMTMLINQYNENEMEKRTFEQIDWIDKCFKWMCWIKTFHYQDANSQCIQRSSVCHCLRREKRERDTR